ncbi:MAG: response regulator, partial [Acidimicrobiales bacterium]
LHDLRQPLAAIAVLTAVVEAHEDLPGDLREQLRSIKEEAQRAYDLCEGKVNDQQLTVPVRLDRIATSVVQRAEITFAQGAITAETEPITILSDEVAWWRVLGNLVDNACRAAGSGGYVAVRLHRADGVIRLDVDDSGPGFGDVTPGLAGFGLSFAWRIADLHSGYLEVKRAALGGTRVSIVLPVPSDSGAPPTTTVSPNVAAGAPPQGRQVRGSRILVCDDHLSFCESLCELLETRGHVVVACALHPGDARRVVLEEPVDVCLMDLHFPGADGAAGVAAVVEAAPQVPVFVLSAVSDRDEIDRALEAGAVGWISKDVSAAVLLDKIEAACSKVHSPHRRGQPPRRPAAATRGRVAPPSTRLDHRWSSDPLARHLTTRERQVLAGLVNGDSTASLSVSLGVTEATARTHVQSILQKLGVHSRVEAVAFATKNALLLPGRFDGDRIRDASGGGS